MPIALTQAAVDDAVKPTIAKFIYEVKTLGLNATTIYQEITGVDDGNYYGRFTASGNPLIPFTLSATSVDAMIETRQICESRYKPQLTHSLWSPKPAIP
jgi:hypothetical protein